MDIEKAAVSCLLRRKVYHACSAVVQPDVLKRQVHVFEETRVKIF